MTPPKPQPEESYGGDLTRGQKVLVVLGIIAAVVVVLIAVGFNLDSDCQ